MIYLSYLEFGIGVMKKCLLGFVELVIKEEDLEIICLFVIFGFLFIFIVIFVWLIFIFELYFEVRVLIVI